MATEQLPNWQHELLPHAVDRLARERPNAPYGLWPVAQASYEAGFRTIDYAQLANMVNGLARWIEKHIGTNQNGQQVLAYIGLNDVRLTAMLLASVKAGHVLFLTSPRNSPDIQQSLFTDLQCRTLVTTDPPPPPVAPLLEAVKPRPHHVTIPSIDELLAEKHPVFAYDKSFEEARWDPLFIIHSSGSTGMPKPKVFTQESGARHIACSLEDQSIQPGITSVEVYLWGKRVMVTMPPFHGAGLAMFLFWAIPFKTVPIAPAAVGIVTAKGLLEALEQTPAEVAFLVPSVVVELAQDPVLLSRCAKYLELILYAGGDLPQALGDRVAAVIPLRSWWGASECGLPHQLAPPVGPQDWRFMRFHPSVGAVFEHITEDKYELVMQRDEKLLQQQVCFSIRGQESWNQHRTKDLFQRHPTVPDAWCWRGRADDIIVFLNGEKTNPVSMEQHIVASNPEVTNALVVGTRRFQAALLIEPAASSSGGGGVGESLDTIQQAALIERIWPSVQEANKTAPAFARIEKALILILPGDRPLIRTGKGTIQRAASIAQYAADIDALYENADVVNGDPDNDVSGAVPSIDLTDAESISRFIRESVDSVTGGGSAKTETDAAQSREHSKETFFDRGMDSLMALQLLRTLRRGLNRPDLGLSTIYSNPTVSQLEAAITTKQDTSIDTDEVLMEPLLKTYLELIQRIPKPKPRLAGHRPQEGPVTVVLTGSTGTIGTFLLRALLDRPDIKHVICLNRSRDGGYAAQRARFAAAGLDIGDLDQHVTFLRADLSQPFLGLDKQVYEDLFRADLIIHNAWPVNFNLGLAAFQPQLAGLVNLFRLAADTTLGHTARLVFVSSVGAVAGLVTEGKPVPEKVFTAFNTPSPSGYARSKFLSELLCDSAAKTLGVPAIVVRVGQVAGAVRQPGGEWNRTEWLPSLVIGSKDLGTGCLPDNIGPLFSSIDWIPADILADVLADIAAMPSVLEGEGTWKPEKDGAQVFNLRNPCTTTWESLLPTIIDEFKKRLPPDQSPEVVAPSIWLERLSDSERKAAGNSTLPPNPALKLLDFYRNSLWGAEHDSIRHKSQPMEIEHSLAKSSALRELQAVNSDWMSKWVGEWLATDEADGL